MVFASIFVNNAQRRGEEIHDVSPRGVQLCQTSAPVIVGALEVLLPLSHLDA